MNLRFGGAAGQWPADASLMLLCLGSAMDELNFAIFRRGNMQNLVSKVHLHHPSRLFPDVENSALPGFSNQFHNRTSTKPPSSAESELD